MPIPALFTSPRAQVDLTKFGPAHWNAVTALLEGLFDGADADGTVLTRDSTSDTGAAWVVGGGGGGGVGPQGPQGETGETGATGAAGAAGAAGSQGIQGSQGIPGDAGAAGAAGAQGIQGVPGAAGDDGATGATGPAGETGLSYFRLAADGSAIGPTIADYFGANSAFATEANAIYEVFYYLVLSKASSGTVTYTLKHTVSMPYVAGFANYNAGAGISPTATAPGGGIVAAGTDVVFPVGPTLSVTAHRHLLHAIVECGASAGNLRLRATQSAGTLTPARGSYYTVRKLDPANVGTFVA